MAIGCRLKLRRIPKRWIEAGLAVASGIETCRLEGIASQESQAKPRMVIRCGRNRRMPVFEVKSLRRLAIRKKWENVVTRQLLALIVGTLTLVPYAVNAQEPTKKKAAQPESNQVYVKIIVPTALAAHNKDSPVVESWIAERIKKRSESKYAAGSAWVVLVETGEEFEDPTLVWEGGCRVHAEIVERKNGGLKVFLDGWSPFAAGVTVSLADEPGSRKIVAAKKAETKHGVPYVAVLICPPPDKPTVIDHKK